MVNSFGSLPDPFGILDLQLHNIDVVTDFLDVEVEGDIYWKSRKVLKALPGRQLFANS